MQTNERLLRHVLGIVGPEQRRDADHRAEVRVEDRGVDALSRGARDVVHVGQFGRHAPTTRPAREG